MSHREPIDQFLSEMGNELSYYVEQVREHEAENVRNRPFETDHDKRTGIVDYMLYLCIRFDIDPYYLYELEQGTVTNR